MPGSVALNQEKGGPWLFCHGFPVTSAMWIELIPAIGSGVIGWWPLINADAAQALGRWTCENMWFLNWLRTYWQLPMR